MADQDNEAEGWLLRELPAIVNGGWRRPKYGPDSDLARNYLDSINTKRTARGEPPLSMGEFIRDANERKAWEGKASASEPVIQPIATPGPQSEMQPSSGPIVGGTPDIVRPATPVQPATAVNPTLSKQAQQLPRDFERPQLVQPRDPWGDFVKDGPAGGDPWADFVKTKESAFDEKPLSWSDVPGEALANLPSSAGRFASDLIQPILHPIDTVTNLADVAAGGLRAGAKAVLPEKAFKFFDEGSNTEANARIEAKANAVGQFFKDRYGSAEGIKKTLATDPVGAAGDAAAVLMGGGAAVGRAPGIIGKAGAPLQAAGYAIDPIQNAIRLGKASGSTVAGVLGTTTGAGDRPIREAFRAGQTGNQAFTDSMRGMRPVADVVDLAENAVGQMGRDRAAAYNQSMQALKQNQGPVSLAPVRQSLNDAADIVSYQGVVKNQAAADTLNSMERLYNDFLSLPKQSAESLDALKQAFGDIYKETKQGTSARTVAGNVYNAAKSEITKQVPSYASAMRDYANASDSIGEMRRTLSVNDRATVDTTLRKLQSTMRNNVNTNYGHRERLLDTLARYEPSLPPSLAGQTLNSMAPRGLARISPMSIAAHGLATMNPATAALLPFTSPRLMGEAAYAAGRVAGKARDIAGRFGVGPEGAKNAGRMSYASSIEERAQTNQRQKDAGVAVDIARKSAAKNLDFSQGRPIVDTVKRLANSGLPRRDIIRELSNYQSGRNVTPAQVAVLDEIIAKLLQAPRRSVIGAQ